MPWRQLSFTLPERLAEEVSELLERWGAQAVTFSEGGDEELFEPPPGATPLWQQTRATALFSLETDTAAVAEQLQTRYPELEDWEHQVLEDQPWERAWLAHFHPLNFGRLWVCPSGQSPPDPAAVCLTLDPGLAFGTGTHPTTALCLEWLAETDLRGKTVIDYGCGSGILAVAALLLGAKQVIACDIDPQALTATRDNAAKNRVAERLVCHYPDDMPATMADIVLANILAGPLIELAPTLSAYVQPTGQLVLSGILESQWEDVQQAYTGQFHFDPPNTREGWVRLTGQQNTEPCTV